MADGPRAGFARFIGIDLGGGRGKNTAVARLEHDGARLKLAEAKVRHGHRGGGGAGADEGDAWFRDDVLADYLERWVDERTVVAISAPLTLPPCVRCTLPCPTVARCSVPVVAWMREWAPRVAAAAPTGGSRGRGDPGKPRITPYTQRATEILLQAAGLSRTEALGQGNGPLAARAAYLRRLMSPRLRLHENLVEVHPQVTVARLFGAAIERRARQGARGEVWEARKRILAGLADGVAFDYVWPELVVRNTHVFDAVVSAFTALLWARGAWRGPSELDFAVREPEHAQALRSAAEALGELWLEDGWIQLPPRAG
jgi:hypothetical protein